MDWNPLTLTAATSHEPIFWLKLFAVKNMPVILVTELVSQFPMSSLKDPIPEKREVISVTNDVSHVLISP